MEGERKEERERKEKREGTRRVREIQSPLQLLLF